MVSIKSMKTKNDQEKDNRYTRPYQVKLYADMEIMIGADDPVRLIDEILEGIDYSELRRAYSPRGKKPKTKPETMFKVIVYGWQE